MLDELLMRQAVDAQRISPSEEVVNMKEHSRYLAMMNSLKQKVGKAKKSKVDAEIAEKEAKIAVNEARAQGML